MSIMIVRMAVWSGPMVNELTLDEIGTLEGTDRVRSWQITCGTMSANFPTCVMSRSM